MRFFPFTTTNIRLLLIACAVFASGVSAADGPNFVQLQDVVYSEVHGTGLLMDVFTPTGESNGKAIIDVASGAWYSDRGKIRDHTLAQLYSTFCGRGYVVFAIRPGSKTRYTALEMDQHVKSGIRFVKANALKYKIDASKLGLTGASAGGHLATLAALTPLTGDAMAKNPLERHDTTVYAVAVFFPPTDFVEWKDGKMLDARVLGPLLAIGATPPKEGPLHEYSDQQLLEMAKAISPLHQVRKTDTPFLLIHGDADEVVPISHSRKLVKAIEGVGGSAELIVKEGGGHPWPTLPVEVAVMADWFEKKLN